MVPHAAHIAFVVPALAVLLLFALIPSVQIFRYALTNWTPARTAVQFIGLHNFAEMLHDDVLRHAVGVTLLFAALDVPLLVGISLVVALALNRKTWLTGLTRTVILIPMALSPVALGILFRFLTSPSVGLGRHFINTQSPAQAMALLIGVDVWSHLGIGTFMFLAGLQTIDTDVLEAAQIDGAGPMRRLSSIIMPLLTRTTAITTVFMVSHAFRNFALVIALTNGGPNRATEVLGFRMYEEAFQFFDFGYGSAIAALLFVLIAATAMIPLVLARQKHQAT